MEKQSMKIKNKIKRLPFPDLNMKYGVVTGAAKTMAAHHLGRL
jgi:hypothetical protein